MGSNRSRQEALRRIRNVLADDCACDAEVLTRDGLTYTIAEERSNRRRYPIPAKPLLALTMGAGAVVSLHSDRIDAVRAMLQDETRDSLFSAAVMMQIARQVEADGQRLYGPILWYACSRDRFRPARSSPDIEVALVEREGIAELYEHPGFTNALSYQIDHPRPDMLASVARRNGEIVGVAAASADCDELWQIGVDVVERERQHGIGRSIVSRLTEAVLDAGKVPCYSTAVSNIGSRSLAIRLGYWPAWTELSALDRRD